MGMRGCLGKRNWQFIDNNIFTLQAGLRIAVDICLDHHLQEARKEIDKSAWSNMPQLHIVTSCGMSLEIAKNKHVDWTKHASIEFLQDGIAQDNAPSVLYVNGHQRKEMKQPKKAVRVLGNGLFQEYLGRCAATRRQKCPDLSDPQLRVYSPVSL